MFHYVMRRRRIKISAMLNAINARSAIQKMLARSSHLGSQDERALNMHSVRQRRDPGNELNQLRQLREREEYGREQNIGVMPSVM